MPFAPGGDDLRIVRQALEGAFDVKGLERLVTETHPPVANAVNWAASRTVVAFEVVQQSRQHGVLDQIVRAAVEERPFVPSLRAVQMHVLRLLGRLQAVDAHGMDLKLGLEALTAAGNPFMDTTRLARWIIRAERQICRVRCGQSLGTGFLVGPDLVLTCYHVVSAHLSGDVPASKVNVLFDYRRDAAGKDPVEDPEAWIAIDPTWKIPSSKYADYDFKLSGSEPQADELDFALLKLVSAPGHAPPPSEPQPRGWVDLSKDPALPPEGDPILIVQHPGIPGSAPPAQQPLQISFATPGFEGVIAGGTRVRYKPSTLKGSSGSPVYDRTFAAVALHHNRGQIDASATGLHLNNQGIPVRLIRAYLAAKHTDVLAELRSP